MNKDYKPIACGLYDELELRALRKQKSKITFKSHINNTQTIDCIISDLFIKDKAEYLKTSDGLIFRLDDILEVDGITYKKTC
jgi:Rho-binding antiterminator